MGGSVSRVLTMLYFSTLWYHHTVLISRNVSSYTVVKSIHTTATAKSLQSCPTLCDPIDGSPPGSVIPGILQARTLEWVAISLSNAWKWKVKVKSLSRVRLLATPWTAAYQAPLAMGFSRQEYWSGVPLSSLQYILLPINSLVAKIIYQQWVEDFHKCFSISLMENFTWCFAFNLLICKCYWKSF